MQQLLRLVARRMPDLRSAKFDGRVVRQFAAAGLARCCALLEGIYELSGKGQGETGGVLLRSLAETWAIALYVLLKRDQALYELAATSVASLERLEREFKVTGPWRNDGLRRGLATLQSIAQKSARTTRKGAPREVTFREIFKEELPALLGAKDPGSERLAHVAYGNVYCIESTISTHAGLLSIEPYVDSSVEPWSIRRPPRRAYSDENVQAAGGLLTAALAAEVCPVFGFSKEPYLALAHRFAPALEGRQYPR